LHGVVTIVVWLCFNTTIVVPSSQGLDCSILLWFSIGQSLCKCAILFLFVHQGCSFWELLGKFTIFVKFLHL
jgi:hypothetical protein